MDVAQVRQSSDHWGADPRWVTALRIICLPVAWLYLRLRWEGAEHVPRQGPALLVTNHLSNLDPFMLGAGCPRDLHFLAKKELFRFAPLGFILTRWGGVPVERTRADLEAARIAVRLLREGRMLVVFPEGTRSRTGRLGQFKPGAAHIALRMRVPLVPAAITGTDRVLPPGARWPRPARVFVRYGPAFDLADYYDTPRGPDVLAAATACIRQRVVALLPAAERPLD